MVMANIPDLMVVNRRDKTAAVVGVAIGSDRNIRKKEHKKTGEIQRLKEELERMQAEKASVVLVAIAALGAATQKLREWLQQILGRTPGISVKKRKSV